MKERSEFGLWKAGPENSCHPCQPFETAPAHNVYNNIQGLILFFISAISPNLINNVFQRLIYSTLLKPYLLLPMFLKGNYVLTHLSTVVSFYSFFSCCYICKCPFFLLLFSGK